MLSDLIARCLLPFTEGSSIRRRSPPPSSGHHLSLTVSVSPETSMASSSPALIFNLMHQLNSLEQGDMPITAYLHCAKNIADELASAGRPLTDAEFNVFALKGLRPEFKDLAISLVASPIPLSFSQLHSLLVSHECIHCHPFTWSMKVPRENLAHRCNDPIFSVYTKTNQLSNDSPFCQWCCDPSHTAKSCPFLQQHRSPPRPTAGLAYFDMAGSQFHANPDLSEKHITVSMTNSKVPSVEDDNHTHADSKANNPVVKRIKDDQRVKDDTSEISRADFPEDFVFGTATSSYQFEGAAAQGGRGLGIWDVFTMETPERIFDGSNGNVAVDMYNRYKDDVAMIKKMGFDACRISISWPRILPGGRCTAGINREGITYYNDLINTFLAQGIEPYVTLFHWDLPYCLQQEYDGFLSPKIVDDFREFVELCFWEFGDRVKSWVTLNEPWSYCISGYVTGVFPPSKPAASPNQIGNNLTTYRAVHDPNSTRPPTNHGYFNSDPVEDVYTVARNLLLAHSAAVHSYRTKFQEFQEGKIGIILCCQWYEPFDQNSADDIVASKRAMDFMLGWFLEPVLTGRYPQSMTDFVPPENLEQFSEEESQMLKGSIDFLGLNYYTANYVRNDISPNFQKAYFKDQQVAFHHERDGKPIGPMAASTWLYIVPWGVYKLLKHIKDTYKDIPIYITENGVDEKNDCKLNPSEACVDTIRIKYHQDHLAYILKAINEEVNIKGYFVWSWCDNFEWNEGYTVRFGLVYIDFVNNLMRYPKNSALWFSKFLRKRRNAKTKYSKISGNMSSDNVKFIKD